MKASLIPPTRSEMAPSTERETFYYVAKLAHKAERYDEMVEAMKNAAKMGKDLTPEGKTLFYVGYKNVIGARRASLGFLSSIERKEESGVYEQRAKWIKEYRCKVESELTDICNDVIVVIDKHLMPACTDEESLVYYYTMKGDHYRNLAEFKTGSDRKEVADLSLKAYEAATAIYLPPTHFLRLELAVKFSLLYNDILNLPNSAWRLTVQAFEEAVSEIQNLHKKPHQDSILIMQLLQDASILYTSEIVDDAVAADAAAEVAAYLRGPPSGSTSSSRFPTPIHKWNLPNLPKDTEVWLKRDDLSGMQLSGNKFGKLEFLLADVVAAGADCIITIGGIKSNHCRATAVAAKYLNLDCYSYITYF